jgi:hypothetical protein
MGRLSRFVSLACAALPLLLSNDARAGDGVIEINQACVTSSTGCFPGDSSGFPVTITQSGSYRLTTNLSVPLNTTAIQINAFDVTLDLGGFSVDGLNNCRGYPTNDCDVTSGAPGINSDQYLIAVRNGLVTRMGGQCIRLAGASSEVDRVRAHACGGTGIEMGGAGRVTNSFSGANYANGIFLGEGGVAENNEVRANFSFGLLVPSAPRLSSAVIGNRAFDNFSGGLAFGIGTPNLEVLVSRNVSSDNGVFQIFGGRSLGDNLCNSVFC